MGWKSKFLALLIVYFAGFATAIYCLAPVNNNTAGSCELTQPKSFPYTAIKSDQFAVEFNQKLNNCIATTKSAAAKAGEYIQNKISHNSTGSNGT